MYIQGVLYNSYLDIGMKCLKEWVESLLCLSLDGSVLMKPSVCVSE